MDEPTAPPRLWCTTCDLAERDPLHSYRREVCALVPALAEES